jgi:hypothetical protein
MGLAEKRAMKEAQDGWLPRRQAEIDGLCGGSIPYEVDWDSFADDAKGIQWLEANGPQQVASAVRSICQDELGKEAVRAAIKKVVLRNTADAAGKRLTFEDGVLCLTCAFAQSPTGRFSYVEIETLLESRL